MLRRSLLLAALLLTAAEPASAFISANTIDRHRPPRGPAHSCA